jgi:hypothetical protein
MIEARVDAAKAVLEEGLSTLGLNVQVIHSVLVSEFCTSSMQRESDLIIACGVYVTVCSYALGVIISSTSNEI